MFIRIFILWQIYRKVAKLFLDLFLFIVYNTKEHNQWK